MRVKTCMLIVINDQLPNSLVLSNQLCVSVKQCALNIHSTLPENKLFITDVLAQIVPNKTSKYCCF